ncbi:Putative MetA-pathway of phenol degradation [Flagellimonas taeanensis]|uniref:MetA-pathway of phenol degradation n=1 Tax=Flagellimonas taeanensis TaxID=1005926 RepID=A0A1M6VD88_9FLAO|nr:transporter [Allomuricauda taeanensis]SFC18542.1 Putative MetA-pathway of phenol degradation [Allomuricauda taeanensis]SHK79452.1 Putative MetA-pathway of phenol degradation [Allomuricauda taeanensis]
MDFSIAKRSIFFFAILPTLLSAQYTDVINSNRPGRAVSAYAVGKGVVQTEVGLFYEQQDNVDLNSDSNIFGTDYALRYGLLFEQLEINLEGSFMKQNITYPDFGIEGKLTNFSRNRLGLKYLVYDPYKNPERNKPNLYSWRANNVFQWKNLIPAVSVYGGANFLFGDNPFYPGDPSLSYRGGVNTQSRLSPRVALISNIAYDRIGTDFPEWRYALSVTHAFRDPRWSIFVEGQGISGDRYSDVILRTGVARLINSDFQADFHLGSGFKNSPSRIFAVLGFSYRLDFHKDEVKAIDEQRAGQNGSIKKNANKRKSKKDRKKGKDDIDF